MLERGFLESEKLNLTLGQLPIYLVPGISTTPEEISQVLRRNSHSLSVALEKVLYTLVRKPY